MTRALRSAWRSKATPTRSCARARIIARASRRSAPSASRSSTCRVGKGALFARRAHAVRRTGMSKARGHASPCPPYGLHASSLQPAFLQKHQRLPSALVGLLDLQQMARSRHEAVVVPVLHPERLVGAPGRRAALEVGIGADELHRPA